MLNRGTEDAESPIAVELVHHPSVAADDVDNNLEEGVEQLHYLCGRVGVREGGGAGEVDEQHRNLSHLPTETDALFKHLSGDLGPDLTAEDVPHLSASRRP